MGNNIRGFNPFYNQILKIDSSRSNLQRIMNPFIRDYHGKGKDTAEPLIQSPSLADDTGGNQRQGKSAKGNTTAGIAEEGLNLNDAGPKANAVNVREGNLRGSNDGTESSSTESVLKLDFSSESLMNGIILAEVLGKPKYLRKGRW